MYTVYTFAVIHFKNCSVFVAGSFWHFNIKYNIMVYVFVLNFLMSGNNFIGFFLMTSIIVLSFNCFHYYNICCCCCFLFSLLVIPFKEDFLWYQLLFLGYMHFFPFFSHWNLYYIKLMHVYQYNKSVIHLPDDTSNEIQFLH